MLRADLHVHTHYSPDSEMSPEELVARCLKVGINCLAVTDHNTVEGGLATRLIAPFPVIVGEEVGSSEGEIAGLFLKQSVPPDLAPVDTATRIKEQGGLVSVPHPLDRFRREVISRRALEEILPYIDIVEVFNARNNLNADNVKARRFAQEHGLLMSGGSDAHTVVELGRTYVEMPDFDGTPEGFMEALARGTIVGHPANPLVHALTTFAKVKKRLLGRRGPR